MPSSWLFIFLSWYRTPVIEVVHSVIDAGPDCQTAVYQFKGIQFGGCESGGRAGYQIPSFTSLHVKVSLGKTLNPNLLYVCMFSLMSILAHLFLLHSSEAPAVTVNVSVGKKSEFCD